jgi:hypothetical protein
VDTKSKAEALDALDAALNAAADLTEALRPEDFRDEGQYWRMRRAVSEAGGIVASEAREIGRSSTA